MTKQVHWTATGLRDHALALAKAFDVRVYESAEIAPDDAVALPQHGIVAIGRIVDDTTYAVALHEIGHIVSPTGYLRGVTTGDTANLKRDEEASAWAWARYHALVWTPAMEAVATWAEGTYATSAPAPSPAKQPSGTINWSRFK